MVIWKIAKPTLRKKYIQLLKIVAINNLRIAIRKRMLQDRRKRMLIEANKRVLIEDNENKISVELKAKHNTDLKENDIDGINNTTDLIENTNELDSVYSEQDETLLIFDEMMNDEILDNEIYYICEEPLIELEHIYNSEVKIYIMDQVNK